MPHWRRQRRHQRALQGQLQQRLEHQREARQEEGKRHVRWELHLWPGQDPANRQVSILVIVIHSALSLVDINSPLSFLIGWHTSSGSGSRARGSSSRPSISGSGGARWGTGCAPTSPSPTPSSTTVFRRTRLRAGGRRPSWVRPSPRGWWGRSRSPRVPDATEESATVMMKTSAMTGADDLWQWHLWHDCCQAWNWHGDRVSWLPRALQSGCQVQRLWRGGGGGVGDVSQPVKQ